MYLFSGKKVKITIQYEENTAYCELSPYDPFCHLKKTLIQFFPQITPTHILHLNPTIIKPINQYDDLTQISELSKGKKHLTLLITKPPKVFTPSTEIKGFNTTNTSISQLKCKCSQFTIEHYCSNCKEFSCSECQVVLHKDHKSISIDVKSIDESIKLFAISLQAEISNELNNYIEIETMFKDNMLIDFFSWKEMIIRKLNKIEMFFKNFEEFEAYFKKKFGTIERMATHTSNKIEKIINEYCSDNRNKKNIDKAKEAIEELNQLGEIIKVLIAENASRREEFHTNNEINGLFADLDKIIDKVEDLSLISYEGIKKRIDPKGEKAGSNSIQYHPIQQPIIIKKDINMLLSYRENDNKGKDCYSRYFDTTEKSSNMLTKSQIKSKLPKSMLDLTENITTTQLRIVNTMQSVSVMSNKHQPKLRNNNNKYLFTEGDRDLYSDKKIMSLAPKKIGVIPIINYPRIVLPQLTSSS